MPFYQNVTASEFRGNLLLSDRQHIPTFVIPPNKNQPTQMYGWSDPPYNLVGNNLLTVNYSLNNGKIWQAFVVTLTAGAAQTADQIAADLNNDTNFQQFWTASTVSTPTGNKLMVQAKVNFRRETCLAYISNLSAETILRFNLMAPVKQLPSYFDRHLIGSVFPDSTRQLVKLVQPQDHFLISNAGLSTVALSDWALLQGKSGAFTFQNITTDPANGNRVTQIIEYFAGAGVGDFARKTINQYNVGNTTTQPNFTFQVPYVLIAADLATQPA